MSLRKPAVLLVTSKWWPASARMALALLQHGCRVDVLSPPGHPVLRVPGLGRCWRYRPFDSLGSLRAALAQGRDHDLIVPCDDGVVAQLVTLCAQVPALRGLIEKSIGPMASHEFLLGRHPLLSLAGSLGIRVPETRAVRGPLDVQAWFDEGHEQAVLKRDLSCGGSGVRVLHSQSEGPAAWQALTRQSHWGPLLRQSLIERDPLTWWSRRQPGASTMSLQRYVPGQPANTLMLCWRGELLALVSVSVVETRGATGHATVVRRMHNEDMAEAARRLCQRLRLSGFHGLDFILEAGTGLPWLIEFNPRSTQLGHMAWPGQPSLAATLAAQLRGVPVPAPRHPLPEGLVSLFPQRPLGQVLGHHDVPPDQPALVRALSEPAWPQRQWTYRCYSALRPARPGERVLHESQDL
ncbi:ATP-grasp domain-containing protein [Curvibacter sp. RS43]|uniref:ATP-grasp domain-containing protein n=1 Tax=Curvibacter microcysteis TaxID=3026419 RepID=A0ABT5MMG8_9BURK|nr:MULTISPECIES: ATP-grasp domain-containing protein [unclassified Curvibacter]MDD0811619.1 ATP-grasp domain-containing protein [Curvibacter sp. RS43]MDD0817049.1 ATP-grasp domain-containing protein [Curvibacter sp. HBC28]